MSTQAHTEKVAQQIQTRKSQLEVAAALGLEVTAGPGDAVARDGWQMTDHQHQDQSLLLGITRASLDLDPAALTP